MKVKNLGNSPLTILLEAESESSSWSVEIDGPSGSVLVVLEAFDEVTFVLEVSVPESSNNGDSSDIEWSVQPRSIRTKAGPMNPRLRQQL